MEITYKFIPMKLFSNKKSDLHTLALEFILKNGNLFGKVELNPFFLQYFETKNPDSFRSEANDFINELERNELIIIADRGDGLTISSQNGKLVPVEKVLVKVRLTVKGYDFISERNIRSINNRSIVINIILGIIIVVITFLTYLRSFKNDYSDKNLQNMIKAEIENEIQPERINQRIMEIEQKMLKLEKNDSIK